MPHNRILQSWGRLSANAHTFIALSRGAITLPRIENGSLLAVGKARSYGDSCLNTQGALIDMTAYDRLIELDPRTGHLRAEAGVTLGEIQRLALPRGWLLPVTPGTQFVTLGGAVANDVHGKNHHTMGSFGDHVTHLEMLRSDQGPIRCSREQEPELFAATIGGLGLTGIIREVGVQLRPVAGGWLETETIVFDGLGAFFELSAASEADWEYSVSWLDCTNGQAVRGVFFRANHSNITDPLPRRRVKSVPLTPPISLINNMSVKIFNRLYYGVNKRKVSKGFQDVWSFFYPLDVLYEWNRIYGPRGFYQYQSLVPPRSARAATEKILDIIAAAHQGSFLMVLKVFGDRVAPGMMSFPASGVTFAMDFPNRGLATLDLFDELDRIVMAAGGRLYPAKDARMSREVFRLGYPGVDRFLQWRDPSLGSDLSRRVIG